MSTRAPIEERLRAALEARGQLISAHDLSPARPPVGSTWGTRKMRRVLYVAAAATAAAVAAVVLLLSSNTPDRPRPTPPARHSSPTVTPTSTVPDPVPSPVASTP
ncbi:hypothetical protein [Streptomyces nodosus]|uniref:Uncharacterized protein n=1 Tax=Streptomyces nodosus TaxID=40318 RepID=A0A5P2W8T1_9ACTN|nr:hypothetical protein [Streptomyces nodosus]MBB4795424.1 hypothetical protein [Streptomyces nodosus]QEV42374.1 hypothetical protein CP978_30950 [Streptomyces nodosus]